MSTVASFDDVGGNVTDGADAGNTATDAYNPVPLDRGPVLMLSPLVRGVEVRPFV